MCMLRDFLIKHLVSLFSNAVLSRTSTFFIGKKGLIIGFEKPNDFTSDQNHSPLNWGATTLPHDRKISPRLTVANH